MNRGSRKNIARSLRPVKLAAASGIAAADIVDATDSVVAADGGPATIV